MPAAVSGLQLQSSTQGLPLQLVYGTTRIAPNLIWYGDFVATQQQSSAGSGGKGGVGGGGGGKGGGGSSSYVYQTAVAMALCEGPIAGVGNVYVNKQVISTLASLGLTLLLPGGYSQVAEQGYLTTTNHPSTRRHSNYHGLAYVAASAYQLGNSPQLPNHNFEVFGVAQRLNPRRQRHRRRPRPCRDRRCSRPQGITAAGFPSGRDAAIAHHTTRRRLHASPAACGSRPTYNTQAPASSDTRRASPPPPIPPFVWSQRAC